MPLDRKDIDFAREYVALGADAAQRAALAAEFGAPYGIPGDEVLALTGLVPEAVADVCQAGPETTAAPGAFYENLPTSLRDALAAAQPAVFGTDPARDRKWILATVLATPEAGRKAARERISKAYGVSAIKIGAITAYLTGGCRQRAKGEVLADVEWAEALVKGEPWAEVPAVVQSEPAKEAAPETAPQEAAPVTAADASAPEPLAEEIAATPSPAPKVTGHNFEYDNPVKNRWRELIGEYVEKAIPVEKRAGTRVLCLPGPDMLEAKMWISKGFNPRKIWCAVLPDDQEALARFQKNAQELGVKTHVGDVFGITERVQEKFGLVSLDFHNSLVIETGRLQRLPTEKEHVFVINRLAKREDDMLINRHYAAQDFDEHKKDLRAIADICLKKDVRPADAKELAKQLKTKRSNAGRQLKGPMAESLGGMDWLRIHETITVGMSMGLDSANFTDSTKAQRSLTRALYQKGAPSGNADDWHAIKVGVLVSTFTNAIARIFTLHVFERFKWFLELPEKMRTGLEKALEFVFHNLVYGHIQNLDHRVFKGSSIRYTNDRGSPFITVCGMRKKSEKSNGPDGRFVKLFAVMCISDDPFRPHVFRATEAGIDYRVATASGDGELNRGDIIASCDYKDLLSATLNHVSRLRSQSFSEQNIEDDLSVSRIERTLPILWMKDLDEVLRRTIFDLYGILLP